MNRKGVPGPAPPAEGTSRILVDGEEARGGDDDAASSLLAEHINEDGDAPSSNSAAAAKKRKRQLTRNACIKCRLAKAKV